jgi:hypothetical protein
MSPVHRAPLLLSVLVGLLLGLVAWGFFRAQSHEVGSTLMGTHDKLLLGLLLLACFALGAFLSYILFSTNF